MNCTGTVRMLAGIGLLILLAGCQKLSVEKTFTLNFGDIKSFTPDLPNREQKVNVKMTSTATPVTVYVVLQKDQGEVMKRLENQQAPNPKEVVVSEQGKDVEVEATIPAKTAYVVMLAGAVKDTEVKVSITGK